MEQLEKKLKVIQFIHGFSMGGAETLVKNYCILFDKDKIETIVICLMNHHSPYDQELKDKGIRVIYIYDLLDSVMKGPMIIKKISHRLLGKLLLRSVIHRLKPDIIHSHLTLNNYIEFAAPNNTKLFHTVHTDVNLIWNKSYARQRDFRSAKRLVTKRGMILIALHNEMCNEVNELFRVNNTIVLNNGTFIEQYQDAGEKYALRKKYNIDKEAYIIGHVGRFAHIKNHDFLIDVFNSIYEKHKRSYLWMIGDGSLREDIQTKVKSMGVEEQVIFWGVRTDIPQLLKMMDILIMPSFKEGLSVSLVESQIAGIPSLVSDTIAKESSISNLVHFISLNRDKKDWAKKAMEIINTKRKFNI
ncbi:glycosyltransferase [Lachnospiraceae bacterium WCA-9-b2]|uniref:Glycosyltransferase n=1 Tax=Sporofaciens musculi TaxID=2681861 RepID=A0A7X3SHV7_9FIRM|nr:glycosyltransferase [Sporofaciens musculi]MXP74784.1 glycosyltransferase [Sporofaciens musculi]